ncbi:MAG: 3-deoxy-7-phosphoheptulonate synthase [Candidatus Izemoplasmatales bacterium]|jgi:3-deoxy-7-phosphoheptulonate synthase|nr:3-deoxy-7-phosphoheptulonate synthase [Candidatus Izemoplasmatales bacterium]MDD4354386.1 3-deoxy-7-phosphoheptulonate synthase [Candidatus Izemoplasmatales bacterium]MDD4987497.1 3-deoxy-7-phosphoheptulonate synthase [Candidatus Izemoplasmatales bacterium]MDY0373820.1 3-deoxy-7-phosphoheptulonate synthase [Candidatus Izemoplasmatales bacterium]
MIIKFKHDAPLPAIESLKQYLINQGFHIHESIGESVTIMGVVGDTTAFDFERLYAYDVVESVLRVQEPFKMVNRKFHPDNSIVDVGGVAIGGNNIVIMAGPCAVESPTQMETVAPLVKEAGAKILRGGAFKPRTSPYSFQGTGKKGLDLLASVGKKYGLPVVSEIMDIEELPHFLEKVDLIQVGARNMQNFSLLKALGRTQKPILLKRGMANTIDEWLMSAEYIVAGGNPHVILCERGIRTFETSTRNTLDISAIPVLKKLSHLPVVVDPSHASGRWEYIDSLSLAAIAAGADGLIIEVHPSPELALSDGQQSLRPDRFLALLERSRRVAEAIDRTLL